MAGYHGRAKHVHLDGSHRASSAIARTPADISTTKIITTNSVRCPSNRNGAEEMFKGACTIASEIANLDASYDFSAWAPSCVDQRFDVIIGLTPPHSHRPIDGWVRS